MKRYIRKILEVIKDDGIISLINRSIRNIINLLKILIYNDRRNASQWNKLKNKYKGERAFIIGNGPSINKTELYYLKNEYTLCVNRFNLMYERLNWTPSFYLIDDDLVIGDMVEEIGSIAKESEYVFLPGVHLNGKVFKNKIINSKIYWFFHTFGEFSCKAPFFSTGGTVIYTGLQILKHMGFNDIVMIGVDMNYKIHTTAKTLKGINIESLSDDDPNHFDPRYFGENRKYHQPENEVVQNMKNNLNKLSKTQSDLNINIINAGYDSKLLCFEKKPFKSFFTFKNEDVRILFDNCLKTNSKYASVEEFESINMFIHDKKQIKNLFDFYTSMEYSKELLSTDNSIVFSHIPIGPYDDKYYFIQREKDEI